MTRSHSLSTSDSDVIEQCPAKQRVAGPDHGADHGQSNRQRGPGHRSLDEFHQLAGRSLTWALVQQPPQQDGQVEEVQQAAERGRELGAWRVDRATDRVVEDALDADPGEGGAWRKQAVIWV